MASVKAARNGSFAMFILGFIAFMVSYGAPYWYSAGLRHEGLWKTCIIVGDGKECVRIQKDNSDAWIKGVQATMSMALAWQIFSLIAYIVWLKKDSDVIRKRGMTADGKTALIFNCLAGVCIACGVISYGSMFDSKSVSSLCWGYYLAIMAGAIQLVVSIITLAFVGCEGPEGHGLSPIEMELEHVRS